MRAGVFFGERFEEVEALTVVDVNSGKFVSSTSQEDTILKTEVEDKQFEEQEEQFMGDIF